MRPCGRPIRGCEDNIRMDLREIGWEDVDGCIWLRIRTIKHGYETSGSIKDE
jgi:hypothetical protein